MKEVSREADGAAILAEQPYAVFAAAGAQLVRPQGIPGMDGDNVTLYTDVLVAA